MKKCQFKKYFSFFSRTIVFRGLHLGVLLATIVSLSACSKADPDILAGEEIFNGTCKVCHAQGLNGAPILGNKKMWDKRATQGLDTLVKHATGGYELMPARGGNEDLSDTQITQAIKYMLAQLEN